MSLGPASLLVAFWEICLLKRGPQDLPASAFLFQIVLGCYVVCGTTINWIGFSFIESLVLSLAMSGFLLLVIRVLLTSKGVAERIRQTTTAIMGTAVLLFVPALAIRYWFYLNDQAGVQSTYAAYLWVTLFVWDLFISAHILRHALNTKLFVGFVLSIVYVLLEFQILHHLHRGLEHWLA